VVPPGCGSTATLVTWMEDFAYVQGPTRPTAATRPNELEAIFSDKR
jgi:hypothetical protein